MPEPISGARGAENVYSTSKRAESSDSLRNLGLVKTRITVPKKIEELAPQIENLIASTAAVAARAVLDVTKQTPNRKALEYLDEKDFLTQTGREVIAEQVAKILDGRPTDQQIALARSRDPLILSILGAAHGSAKIIVDRVRKRKKKDEGGGKGDIIDFLA